MPGTPGSGGHICLPAGDPKAPRTEACRTRGAECRRQHPGLVPKDCCDRLSRPVLLLPAAGHGKPQALREDVAPLPGDPEAQWAWRGAGCVSVCACACVCHRMYPCARARVCISVCMRACVCVCVCPPSLPRPAPPIPCHHVALSMLCHSHGSALDPPPHQQPFRSAPKLLAPHTAPCIHQQAADGTGHEGDREPPGSLPLDGGAHHARPSSAFALPVRCAVCVACCTYAVLHVVPPPAHALLPPVLLPSSRLNTGRSLNRRSVLRDFAAPPSVKCGSGATLRPWKWQYQDLPLEGSP